MSTAHPAPLPVQVGDHTRKWEEGKVVVCDTSFMHETHNGTEHERVVLIMRHFHPEVSAVERRAVRFLFDCLDDPSPEGVAAAQRRADPRAVTGSAAGAGGKRAKKGGSKAGGGGGGFGGGKGFGKA